MSDRDGKIEPLSINIIPGSVAPRFDAVTHELTCIGVMITEQGMASHKPMVDFVFLDADGKRYFFTTSGAMLRLVAAAIGGVNERNHGTPDP